ncbi:hypothetical protein GALL_387570 [mine drainage metagenome]|uniref:Uncharacterized protein n=1 Tax=mine drainage metagenome TaxID=410659 RepID=A0A1J5QHN1_9ZZZZ
MTHTVGEPPRRRLRPALREEPVATADHRDDRHHEPGRRLDAGREVRGEHGPDDEDELVQRGLERVGRVDLTRVVEQVRPPRADERSEGPDRRAGDGSGGVQRHCRCMDESADHEPDQPDRRDRDRGSHHPVLAVPVDEPRELRRRDGLGDDVESRDATGQAVGAVQGRHHQHDADAHHRDREPGDHTCGRECQCARPRQDLAVGREHRASLSPDGARLTPARRTPPAWRPPGPPSGDRPRGTTRRRSCRRSRSRTGGPRTRRSQW